MDCALQGVSSGVSDVYISSFTRLFRDMKKYTCFLLNLIIVIMLTGCAAPDLDRKVVFTTGFSDGEVFRIEDSTCTLTEIMVYLVNTQEGYETYLGADVWEKETDTGFGAGARRPCDRADP